MFAKTASLFVFDRVQNNRVRVALYLELPTTGFCQVVNNPKSPNLDLSFFAVHVSKKKIVWGVGCLWPGQSEFFSDF